MTQILGRQHADLAEPPGGESFADWAARVATQYGAGREEVDAAVERVKAGLAGVVDNLRGNGK